MDAFDFVVSLISDESIDVDDAIVQAADYFGLSIEQESAIYRKLEAYNII
jgi:hypothetical protein